MSFSTQKGIEWLEAQIAALNQEDPEQKAHRSMLKNLINQVQSSERRLNRIHDLNMQIRALEAKYPKKADLLVALRYIDGLADSSLKVMDRCYEQEKPDHYPLTLWMSHELSRFLSCIKMKVSDIRGTE